jgi:hypothetical protein
MNHGERSEHDGQTEPNPVQISALALSPVGSIAARELDGDLQMNHTHTLAA